jgi:hypothetical protein
LNNKQNLFSINFLSSHFLCGQTYCTLDVEIKIKEISSLSNLTLDINSDKYEGIIKSQSPTHNQQLKKCNSHVN